MSKPAVAAIRAISTPRTRRTVMDDTTSSRASFSLTMLRTTSAAFTRKLPLRRIRQFDCQHYVTVALAVNVLRQRDGDAAGERILDHEIECLEIAQGVPTDRPLGNVTKCLPDALDSQFAVEELPVRCVVANHRDVRRVALVARAGMGEIVDADAHSEPSTTTCGLTAFFGNSTDFTARTSRTRGSQAPPAPPGPCICIARTSKPTACAALRSCV